MKIRCVCTIVNCKILRPSAYLFLRRNDDATRVHRHNPTHSKANCKIRTGMTCQRVRQGFPLYPGIDVTKPRIFNTRSDAFLAGFPAVYQLHDNSIVFSVRRPICPRKRAAAGSIVTSGTHGDLYITN